MGKIDLIARAVRSGGRAARRAQFLDLDSGVMRRWDGSAFREVTAREVRNSPDLPSMRNVENTSVSVQKELGPVQEVNLMDQDRYTVLFEQRSGGSGTLEVNTRTGETQIRTTKQSRTSLADFLSNLFRF